MDKLMPTVVNGQLFSTPMLVPALPLMKQDVKSCVAGRSTTITLDPFSYVISPFCQIFSPSRRKWKTWNGPGIHFACFIFTRKGRDKTREKSSERLS